MDDREKSGDPQTLQHLAHQAVKSEIWTTIPVEVVDYNPLTKTCSLQPTIQAAIQNPDSEEIEWLSLPVLLDCPVIFPSGGGYTLTFPILPGDEGLVMIADRCIDGWWELGGIQPQLDFRMHDLSDGFFLPGANSLPKVTPAISPTNVELRSADGLMSISMGPLGINVTHPVSINLLAPLVTVNFVPI